MRVTVSNIVDRLFLATLPQPRTHLKDSARCQCEAAVATAVPDPQGADADQTADAIARHRRDQGTCRDGQQADLAERAQAAAQRADDAIAAVQGTDPVPKEPG